VKGKLGFEGIKGGKKEGEGAFWGFGFLAEIEGYGRGRRTDWFTGRSWEASAFL
jgi:hypothetical protein